MNVNNIGVMPMQPMNSGALGGLGSAETGEFDFLEYFLGLQAGPTPTDNPLELGVPNSEVSELFESLEQTGISGFLNSSQLLSQNEGPVAQAVSQVLQGDRKSLEGQQPLNLQLLGGLIPSEPGLSSEVGLQTAQQPEVVLESVQADLPAPTAAQLDVASQLQAKNLQTSESASIETNSMELQSEDQSALSGLDQMEEVTQGRTLVQGSDEEKEQDLYDLAKSDETPISRVGTDSPLADLSVTPKEMASSKSVSSSVQMPDVHVPESNLREVASGIQSLKDAGGGTMKISLNPPELGEVEIKVTNHGKDVGIEIRSESATTKSLLEANLGTLRTAIHAQDLTVSKLEVQQGSLNQNHHQRNDSMPSFEHSQNGQNREQNWQNLSRYQQSAPDSGSVMGTAYGQTRSESRVDLRV